MDLWTFGLTPNGSFFARQGNHGALITKHEDPSQTSVRLLQLLDPYLSPKSRFLWTFAWKETGQHSLAFISTLTVRDSIEKSGPTGWG